MQDLEKLQPCEEGQVTLQIETVTLECEPDVANVLTDQLARFPAIASQRANRKNLDGGLSLAVVLASVAIRALPQVLQAIRGMLEDRRITSITIGNTTIEKPTVQQVDDLIRLSATRQP